MKHLNIEEIHNTVIACISEYTKVTVELKSKLAGLNLNSIDFIKVLVNLENQLEFEFDEDEVTTDLYETVEDLGILIYKKMRKAD